MIEHTWLLAVGDAMNINELYFTFTTFSLGFHREVFVSEGHEAGVCFLDKMVNLTLRG